MGYDLTTMWRQKTQSVLDVTRFDEMDWSDITKMLPDLQRHNQITAQKMGGNPTKDAFWAMHKSNPILKPSPGLEVLGQVFDEAMQTPGYEDLRRSAGGDMVGSAVAAQCFTNILSTIIRQDVQDNMQKSHEAANTLAELIEKIGNLDNLMAAMGEDASKQAVTNLKRKRTDLVKKARQAEGERINANAAAREGFEEDKASFTARFSVKATEQSQTVDSQMDFVSGFSEAIGGDGTHVSLETASQAMNLLARNYNLRKLGDFLGWAKRSMRAAWRKSSRGTTDFTGYKAKELNPAHLASWEYAAMISPNAVTKLDFMSRVADGGVYHRHYSGEEQKHKGGMVIVRDESISMRGERHSMAVAIEWALLEMARKDKRPFFSVPFADDHHVWAAEGATAQSLTTHLEHFYNQGTTPWPALITALNLIDAGDMEADILFLTDEQFGTPWPQFNKALTEAKQRRPLKIVVVVIGHTTNLSAEWADKVIEVADIVGEKERFSEVFDFMA